MLALPSLPHLDPSSSRAETLLTPCWQQAFDRKGAGKLAGVRLLFERKLP
jgi:hypothetical protein